MNTRMTSLLGDATRCVWICTVVFGFLTTLYGGIKVGGPSLLCPLKKNPQETPFSNVERNSEAVVSESYLLADRQVYRLIATTAIESSEIFSPPYP